MASGQWGVRTTAAPPLHRSTTGRNFASERQQAQTRKQAPPPPPPPPPPPARLDGGGGGIHTRGGPPRHFGAYIGVAAGCRPSPQRGAFAQPVYTRAGSECKAAEIAVSLEAIRTNAIRN
jgi:hypothetical protein